MALDLVRFRRGEAMCRFIVWLVTISSQEASESESEEHSSLYLVKPRKVPLIGKVLFAVS